MFKGKRGLTAALFAAALFILPAAQAMDGVYQGTYDKKPVKASLDILKSSLTGTVSIGEQQYLLEADDKGNGNHFNGKLYSIADGKALKVDLVINKGRVHFQVTGADAPMAFTLEKAVK